MFVNPQSMLNLAIYDHQLLSNINGNIHYVCSKYYDYLPLPANVHQHCLFRYNHLHSNATKAISYLLTHIQLFFCLMLWQPEVIHIQWLRIPLFDFYFYKIIKSLLHCKIIFTAHNILPHDTGERHKKAFAKFYSLADYIIVHSSSTKQELLSTFHIDNSKVRIIEHGILSLNSDPQKLQSVKSSLESRYQLAGKMVFSSLGHQYYYKGVDIIAKVWAETPELRENEHCRLLFAGRNRGVDFSAVKDIKNVIVDDRMLSDEEFDYLLRNTDVHLLTYRTISQSGLLLTAISTETPILTTNVGGLTEPFSIAPIGWVLDRLDEEHVRQQLLWLVNHPEEVEKVKNNKNGWNKLKEHYSWSRIGQLTQQLYSN